jgi:hypothetical protein
VAAQTVSFKEQPMQLFSWLTKRMTGRPQKRRVPASRPAPRFRPQLEALEERWALSTLTVLNNLDSGAGSLRAEIAAAKSNDPIVFAPSLSGQTITLTGGELLINKNLTITGPGAGQLAVSGNNVSRAFEVAAKKQVALSGLTIENGNANSSYGGGIGNRGSLTVSGCTVSGNRADEGGGIFNDAGATLTASGCTLSGNHSYEGGGLFNRGKATVANCTLSGNSSRSGDMATGYGGGIYNDSVGLLTVSGCTLSGNYAGSGGGSVYNAGRLTVLNSIFSGNYDHPESGGIYPDNIRNTYGNYYTDGGGNTFH